VLLEPVRKTLDMVGNKKTVQAVDDLPLEITHLLPVRWPEHKTIVSGG